MENTTNTVGKVIVKEGHFTEVIGSDEFSHYAYHNHATVNGWRCRRREDGSIVCRYSWKDITGTFSMKYKILPNGYAVLTKETPLEGNYIVRKGFVIPKGVTFGNGAIIFISRDKVHFETD